MPDDPLTPSTLNNLNRRLAEAQAGPAPILFCSGNQAGLIRLMEDPNVTAEITGRVVVLGYEGRAHRFPSEIPEDVWTTLVDVLGEAYALWVNPLATWSWRPATWPGRQSEQSASRPSPRAIPRDRCELESRQLGRSD
jgi:hypothetical protein